MTKRKNKLKVKLLAVTLVMIIAIGSIAYAIPMFSQDASGDDSVYKFYPLNAVNPEIECRGKVKLIPIDTAGNELRGITSLSQTGNPILPYNIFDFESRSEISGDVAILQFNCNNQYQDILINPSHVTFEWLALDKGGIWKQIKFDNVQSKTIVIPKGSNTQVNVAWSSVYGSEVNSKLTSGTYDSFIQVKVGNTLDVAYASYPTFEYYFGLNPNTLKVSHPTIHTDTNKLDRDNDGIVDASDACPDTKENFNGYQDTDGCPDSPPVTQSPAPSTGCGSGETLLDGKCVVIDTDAECKAKYGSNYVWNVNTCLIPKAPTDPDCMSISSDPNTGIQNICIGDPEFNLGGVCYQKSLTQCAEILRNGGAGGIDTNPDGISIPAFTVIDMEVNYLDGSSTHKAFAGDPGFDIILNSLVGFVDGGQAKSIGSVIYKVYLGTYGNELQGWVIQGTDLRFDGSVHIASKIVPVATKVGTSQNVGEAKALSLLTSPDTQVRFNGLLASQATFTSVEIHNAVANFKDAGVDLLPKGQERDIDFNVDIGGTITLKQNTPGSAVVLNGKLSGAKVGFTTLKMINEVLPPSDGQVYTTFADAEKACGGKENVKAQNGGGYACVGSGTGGTGGSLTCQSTEYIAIVSGVQVCLPKGSSPGTGGTGGTKPTVGQPGVEICVDTSDAGKGGFACTKEYRDTWCNGTTQCEVPPKSTGDSSKTTSTSTAGDTNGDKCTDTKPGTLSVADGVCINSGSNQNNQNGDPGDFCSSAQQCLEKQFNINLNDPLTLGVIILVGLAVLVAVLKRDSKYSPVPSQSYR